MKDLYEMNGIITTVITPFKGENKEIDIQSFRREIQTAIDAGVVGFLVPCNASEMPFLSYEERKLLVKETVDIAKGKAKIISSIAAPTTDERIQQCKEYLAIGADALNLNMPYTNREEYCSYVAEIDALKPPALIIQDASMMDDGLPDDLILRLFNEFESVRGIKIEVKNSGIKYTRILRITNGRMNISGAWGSTQSIEAYDRGIHAMMPSGLFELFVNVYDLYHQESREKARKLFYDMLPIIAFTRQDPALNRYFHKLYFKHIGVFDEAVSREPVLFDEYHQKYACDLIDYAVRLRDRIPEYWK